MIGMFYYCSKLQTIYVGNGWSTAAVTSSTNMFYNCRRLVGGQGTTYSDSNPWDKTYAHIDGGPSNPGYFTSARLKGDLNYDGIIDVSDVTMMISAALNSTPVDLAVADLNDDGIIDVSDVTAVISLALNN